MTKSPTDSQITLTELVLPNDTNVFGNLMGGRLMYWMDISAALCATQHWNAAVVTACMDNISLETQSVLGNAVMIEDELSRAFNRPMELNLRGWR